MTRDEILKMGAGREMDALVAELMGWLKTDSNLYVSPPTGRVYAIFKFWNDEDELNKEIETIGKLLHISNMFKLWQPSTDIAAAWLVVEKIENGPVEILITAGPEVQVKFGGYLGGYAKADTLPLAICRAALLAKMEVVK